MNFDKFDYSKVIHFADEYMKKQEKRYNTVKTKEYFNWLYDFIETVNNKGFSDEDFDYRNDILIRDKENVDLLSYFISFVNELATKQRVLNVTEEDNPYETINYDIKIYNNYYNVSQMHGQGSVNFIVKLEDKPKHCFVNITDTEQ